MKAQLIDFTWMRSKNPVKYRQYCKEVKDTYDQQTLLKYATSILKRDTSDRFEEELQLIQKATEKMQFFQDINLKRKNVENRLHLQCCQKMTLKSFKQGDVIFKENDRGEEAYIILSGKINIYNHMLASDIHELVHRSKKKYEAASLQQRRIHPITIINQARRDRLKAKMALPFEMLKKMRRLKRQSKSNSHTEQELIYQTIHIIEEVKYEEERDKNILQQQAQIGLDLTQGIPPGRLSDLDFFFTEGVFKHKFICELSEGEMFGELALIWNQPRSATCVAKTDLELAVLSGADYKALLKDAELNKIEQQMQFFQQHFFKDAPRTVTLRYCYNFRKVRLQKGNHLYQQDEKIAHIYLIKKGVLELSHIQTVESQTEKHQIGLAHSQDQILMAMKQIELNPHKASQFERIFLNLSPGEIVGDIEIMLKIPQRIYTARVSSNHAKVYQLNLQHFYRILSDQPILGKQFKQAARHKQELYKERIQAVEQFYLQQYEQYKLNQQLFILHQQQQTSKLLQDQEQKSSPTQNTVSLNHAISSSRQNSQAKLYDKDISDLENNSLKALLVKIKSKVKQDGSRLALRHKQRGETQFRIEICKMEDASEQLKKHHRSTVDLVPQKSRANMVKQHQINDQIRNEIGECSKHQKIFLAYKLFRNECDTRMMKQPSKANTERSCRGTQTTHLNTLSPVHFSSKRIDTSNAQTTTEPIYSITDRNFIEKLSQQPIIVKSKHNMFRQKPSSRVLYDRYKNHKSPDSYINC